MLLNQTASPPATISKPDQVAPLAADGVSLKTKSAIGTWVGPTWTVTKADAEPALVEVVNCTRYEPGG